MVETFNNLTPQVYLDHLKILALQLQDDRLNIPLAEDAAVNAWKITEWVWEFTHAEGIANLTANQLSKKRLKFLNLFCTELPEFKLLRDICNLSKHVVLTISADNQKVDKIKSQGGALSSAFSSAFDGNKIVIVTKDGESVLFGATLKKSIEYWETYFDKHNIP